MSAPAAMLLNASGLTVTAEARALLDDVSLQLHAGEVLGVVGPNGAGKSTLLKVLSGVQSPNTGSVQLLNAPLAATTPSARARVLAYLEQRPQVHWPLSVAQVAGLARLPHDDFGSPVAERIVQAALDATDTTALRARAFHTLSEGEKMRAHLARVLAGSPRVILADEPIAALDPWHQLQVLELLRGEAARGTGVILVLHDLQLAARFCDRLLLLDSGRTAACGTPRDVLTAESLADIWRIDASVDSATLRIVIHGRRNESA
jgi:iron complex transport system ATP-binding protein